MAIPVVVNDPLSQEVVVLNPLRALKRGGVNIDALAATGAGGSVYTADKGYLLWIVRASAVTTGGTVLIQGSDKNSSTAADWYTIGSAAVTANGSMYVKVLEEEWHPYMRANVSVRTDGTYTVSYFYSDRKG